MEGADRVEVDGPVADVKRLRANPGQKFTFKAKPMADWDGVLHCEVMEIVENRKLVYSWIGGSDTDEGLGSRRDSTVELTLRQSGGNEVENGPFGPQLAQEQERL